MSRDKEFDEDFDEDQEIEEMRKMAQTMSAGDLPPQTTAVETIVPGPTDLATSPEPGDKGGMVSVEVVEGLQPLPQELMMEQPTKATRGKSAVADVFKNLIPSSDRLFVYKINERGHKGYIANYSSSDLNRSQGIEMFIKDYVVPTWGSGDYIVEVRDAAGKVKKHGLVPIPAPVTPQEKSNVLTLQDILATQQQMQMAADKKASEQMTNMASMMTLFKDMMPKQEKGSGGDGGAMMMPMMMMMMQMMNQQQRSNGPDPITQLLMQKLSHLEQSQPVNLPPPISLPMPAPAPTHEPSNTAELLKTVLEVAKSTVQPQSNSQNDMLMNLLASLLANITKPDKSSITAKDILEMMPTIKELIAPPKEGISTFNDYLDGLMKLDEIRGGHGEGPSLLAGLAEMVTGVIRDIKMQQMQLEYSKTPGSKMIAKQNPQRQLRVVPNHDALPNAEKQDTERKSKVPAIPVTFRKFSVRMNNAYQKKEDGSLIMAFFEGLLHLRENSAEWAPYIEEMMVAAAKGDKVRALKFCEVFLFAFAKNKLIDPKIVGVTKKVLSDNWETIIRETGLSKAMESDEDQEPEPESESASNIETVEGVEIASEEEETADEEDDEVDPADYGIDLSEKSQ